ncbi:MAG: ribosomal protein S18-alanine N-acetyltransferase [Lachnospiraceae bacterium]
MSEIRVRRMSPADVPEVCLIERQNFSVPWSEKSFRESMERTDTIFLTVLCDEIIAGYVGCYCICGVGEITNVAVREEYRRRGLARALLNTLFEEGKTLDTEEFFLEVRESNEAAIGLYTSLGFVKEGIRKNFYEKPVENAIIMKR